MYIQDAAPGTTQWLLMTAHHIIVDERSMDVLQRELGSIYTAILQGRQPYLPPCQVQYPDFAHWQRCQLESGKLERPDQLLAAAAPASPCQTRAASGHAPPCALQWQRCPGALSAEFGGHSSLASLCTVQQSQPAGDHHGSSPGELSVERIAT